MQGKIYPLDYCSGAWETLLSQIIPAAIRTMPEIFLALILWNIRASKRIPAVNWPTRRRIVDSITFRWESVTMVIRKAGHDRNAQDSDTIAGSHNQKDPEESGSIKIPWHSGDF